MDNSEKLIFTYELSRLKEDYKRCEDGEIKQNIIEDINVIEKALQLILRSS